MYLCFKKNSSTRRLINSLPKKPYMLLVLLLSYVNLFQRTLLYRPEECFIFVSFSKADAKVQTLRLTSKYF